MDTLQSYYEGGPKTWNEAFPPICVKSHWDPTMVTSYILPTAHRDLVTDPRPSTKICTTYYNISQGDAPIPDSYENKPMNIPSEFLGGFKRPESSVQNTDSKVMPPGGSASLGFPFSVYQSNVDKESNLQLLNKPLTRCGERKYVPNGGVPAPATSTNRLPNSDVSRSSLLSPYATFVAKQAGCRNQDDQAAWNQSARLFFNPTRYDRTKGVPTETYTAKSGNALQCP
jgi:hypothetical protein